MKKTQVVSTPVLSIVLPGNPIPKHRPRFANGRVYNDQARVAQSLSFLVRAQCRLSTPVLSEPISKPVSIDTVFYMQIPKSMSKKKQLLLLGTYHSIRPDL